MEYDTVIIFCAQKISVVAGVSYLKDVLLEEAKKI